ncbi:ArpU family phage packaging/lysis transcriptional regulator [Paenibacillus sp. UNC451MF]|uniref:ArpU family phage packaging/lysis transcriptional regulator n=1 Tax=Paenibacillus sp. UNC451MF TaxID=1449063 RepID=UPI0005646177|nr:ArpU family phage packaging/lysis transcriptional regulator [Paenibacillus sp. UNC451MF]
MGQLKITFPMEIDREATRQAVEERLESARIYKQLGFIRRETKTTASYELREGGTTNIISKAAENAAIYNVDTEARLQQKQEQVEMAVSKLNRTERQIIEKRFMEDDEIFDYHVFNDLHMSERKYYRMKSSAIYKLAFALRLEVYVEPRDIGKQPSEIA